MATNHIELSNREIIDKLNALELRLSRLEENSGIKSTLSEEYEETESFEELKNLSDGSLLESKIGESGLAWLGNIVLFLGITFLVQYIQNTGSQLIASVFGYVSVAGIFIPAHYLKKTYPTMASVFNLNGYLLIFYITLRLHFFTDNPLINDKTIGLILLILVAAIQMFIAVRNKSAAYTGVALVLLSISAVISDNTHFMLSMAVVIAAISVLFLYRLNWIRLVYLSIILVYLINFIWFLNNPLMGNQLQAITVHNFGFIYLFVIGAIYSLVALVNKSEAITKSGIIGLLILNGLGFSMLLTLCVLSFFKDNYVLLVGSISAFCLLYSVVLQIRSDWKISAALYALYGFVLLSITVHGIYDFPRAFFLLAIQSLLVVSMAIWFRSRFIIVMNTFLFVILLTFYLATSPPLNGVNISFTIVALLTARILNWKKDRLTIKTDILRNIYLVIGFIMVLATLYYLIPERYITLSWTAVAVLFFGLSLIIKNVKYRYLALGTLIAAALYLFIVDLAKIELVYRIIALLFFALISIGLSIYYSKKSKRKLKEKE